METEGGRAMTMLEWAETTGSLSMEELVELIYRARVAPKEKVCPVLTSSYRDRTAIPIKAQS